MKTVILFSFVIMCCAGLLVQVKVAGNNVRKSTVKADSASVVYSGKLKTVIDNKCFDCHNPESRSEKARNKLDWTKLSSLSKVDQIAKLDKIVEVLDKEDMPPRKYIERKPEAKLTADEAKAIRDWAQKTSDTLLK
ncbi:MAG TPA: heme-binding domain-containing protein [Bacteroidales bacterium]|jgi:hypothetical protein